MRWRSSRCGRRQHRVLELLELVGDAVEDREVVVDDPVGDEVVDEIDAALEELRLASTRRSPDLLERGDRSPSCTVTRKCSPRNAWSSCSSSSWTLSPLAGEPLRHQEQVVAVLLELGALIEVRAVLDGERVEVEALARRSSRFGGVGAVRSIQRSTPGGGGATRSVAFVQLHPSIVQLHDVEHDSAAFYYRTPGTLPARKTGRKERPLPTSRRTTRPASAAGRPPTSSGSSSRTFYPTETAPRG